MPKSKKRKNYISKGQRPNVSKKNRVKSTPSVAARLQSFMKKQQVIDKPQNNIEKELRKRYVKEDKINTEACRLLNRYQICGLQKSTAVQAVMTDKVDILTKKWSKILSEYLEKEKKKSSFLTRDA